MKVRLVIITGIMLLSVGCTNRQLSQWIDWHNQDPVAAEEFANRPEIQQQLNSGSSRENNSTQTNTQRGDVWDRLAECESGQNWSYNGGSGYDGGLQFLPATWRAYGGQEFADFAYNASREAQITVANRVLEDVGWGAWPACSRKLGLR